MRAVIYIRVSTDKQGESGLGLDAQESTCRAFATQKGWKVAFVFQDVISGKCGIDKRLGLMDAVSNLQKGNVLLVSKRDRIARGDVMLVAMIEAAVKRKKARIVSAQGEGTDSDTPEAMLMRGMVDLFAYYERLMIGSRTKAALAAKKRKGERAGQIQYGFTVSGNRLIPSEDQQSVIHRMQVLRSRGESFRAIAKMLNADGVPSPNAGRRVCSGLWSGESVRGILAANPSVVVCGTPV
jgi:DNA invertase Pin-like site-specific DNA recombinase